MIIWQSIQVPVLRKGACKSAPTTRDSLLTAIEQIKPITSERGQIQYNARKSLKKEMPEFVRVLQKEGVSHQGSQDATEE